MIVVSKTIPVIMLVVSSGPNLDQVGLPSYTGTSGSVGMVPLGTEDHAMFPWL